MNTKHTVLLCVGKLKNKHFRSSPDLFSIHWQCQLCQQNVNVSLAVTSYSSGKIETSSALNFIVSLPSLSRQWKRCDVGVGGRCQLLALCDWHGETGDLRQLRPRTSCVRDWSRCPGIRAPTSPQALPLHLIVLSPRPTLHVHHLTNLSADGSFMSQQTHLEHIGVSQTGASMPTQNPEDELQTIDPKAWECAETPSRAGKDSTKQQGA
jgi:hypothetical protein